MAPCLRGVVVVAAVLVLAGCGALPRSSPTAPATEPSTGEPRRGAYYKDDGPGANAPPNLEQTPDAVPRAEPLHRFANRPYEVFGKQYVPLAHAGGFRERGIGSWYGRRYHGQRTSSGEPYDMYAMTAAHPTLPIPGYVRVTNVANGRSVVVRVNDRGPFHAGRVIDLSYTAALKLGYVDAGSALVEIESVLPGGAPPVAARQPAAPLPQPLAGGDGPAGIFLQLGAFSARDNAESFRARVQRELTWLREAIRVSAAGGLFRLHLGPYPSGDEARRDAERIRAELGFAPLLLTR